ncbi:MAG: hypothetical protein WC197_08520 [Candidatus Gastranaerophilaceae bacterium]|jgi:hypothetical protein
MQQFQKPQQQLKTRKAILLFLKNGGPPLVLYVDNPDEFYQELKDIILKASVSSPKLIEKVGKGPLKIIAVLDTQIAGASIQEEPYI